MFKIGFWAKLCLTTKRLAYRDSSMVDKPTVALRASSVRQKAEWERAVDQSQEYANVSHLIKTAVNRELSGMYESDSSGGGVSDSDMRELFDRLEGLEQDMSGVTNELADVKTAVRASDTTLPEETTTAVYAAIPNGPSAATTAEGVAAGLDIEATTVEIACGQLAENHPAVAMIEFQELDDVSGKSTVEWEGREIPIETAQEAVRRQNPLYYKEV